MDKIDRSAEGEKGLKDGNNEQVETLSGLSSWRTLRVYRAAILWSAFMGLAGINWGLDVMVCDCHPKRNQPLTIVVINWSNCCPILRTRLWVHL